MNNLPKVKVERPGVEPATFCVASQQPNHYTSRATNTGTDTGAVPANQPISDGEATDRCKSLRRKMADCPSK